jgi:hypothetical protein
MAAGAAAVAASPAPASFHFMQIEQVIGGVGGDTSAQAVQLRMRLGFQNQVQLARLRAWDATGSNPVLLIDFGSSVPNEGVGVRVLAATASFADFTDPSIAADFTLTNPIPESYLAAGSLTFESDGGIIYWRLSWGGDGYTGPTTGAITNDADGDFGPPWPGPLPSEGVQALLFQGTANAQSTSNATDYALTEGAAVFTNNAGASATVTAPVACPWDLTDDGFVGINDLLILLANWGPNPGHPADFNGDDFVGINDLLALLANWGSCPR